MFKSQSIDTPGLIARVLTKLKMLAKKLTNRLKRYLANTVQEVVDKVEEVVEKVGEVADQVKELVDKVEVVANKIKEEEEMVFCYHNCSNVL